MSESFALTEIIFINSPSLLTPSGLFSYQTVSSLVIFSFGCYLSQKPKKFRFLQVSEIEVFLLLESLHTKTSTGIDKVHPLLLNLPINQSIFPDSMKLAIVVLIFKQGSRPFPVLFK